MQGYFPSFYLAPIPPIVRMLAQPIVNLLGISVAFLLDCLTGL